MWYMVETLPICVITNTGSTHIQVVEGTLLERTGVLHDFKNNLSKAQKTMKSFAYRTRISRHFAIGDLVFVKLIPHQQNSIEDRTVRKLPKRFYGTFKIVKEVGK